MQPQQYLSTRIRNFLARLWTNHRRKLLAVIILVLILVIARALIITWAPPGYVKQRCSLTPPEIRKMERLLEIFNRVAHEQKLPWWIDYGTLLGVKRSGTIIPFDKDMDASLMEYDMTQFMSLQQYLTPFNVTLSELTVCFNDDFLAIHSGEGESVVAKLEMYGMIKLDDGRLTRYDSHEYLTASFFWEFRKWFWGQMLAWTGVAIGHVDDMFPLTTITMRHLHDEEKYKQYLEQVRKAAQAEGKSRKEIDALLFEEQREESAMLSWSIDLPAPRDSATWLQKLYGRTWQREIKWKISCWV